MTYCIDTNALIHSWQFWYAPQTHPTLWDAVESLGRSERLKMPEQVLDELGEKEDISFIRSYGLLRKEGWVFEHG